MLSIEAINKAVGLERATDLKKKGNRSKLGTAVGIVNWFDRP